MAFRKVGERVVHQMSRGISVAVVTYETDGGERFDRDVVRHPGAVGVVPMLDDATAVLVRQHRVSVGIDVLEIPAGIRDVDGEDPADTGRRELVEEVGYRATALELLTVFRPAVGLLDETCHLYLATALTPCQHDRQGHEETAMTIEHVALADVPAMIADGRLVDAKTIIGLFLAREHLT